MTVGQLRASGETTKKQARETEIKRRVGRGHFPNAKTMTLTSQYPRKPPVYNGYFTE